MSANWKFWASPVEWPIDSASYIFLARAINDLGRSIFGGEWTGTETIAERVKLGVIDIHDDLYVNNFLATHAPNSDRKHFGPLGSRSFRVTDASGLVMAPHVASHPEFNITIEDRVYAISLAEELKLKNAPAIERCTQVKNEFVRLAESGELITAHRSIDGGDQVVIPRDWWNTEKIQSRFWCCQIEPCAPFNSQNSGSAWIYVSRASLETLVPVSAVTKERQSRIQLEPTLETANNGRKAKRGRKKGVGSYEKLDRPIVEKMKKMLLSGKAASPEEAARKFADKAHGNGTIESKTERLAKRYRSTSE
jgi:hypothetical protein